MPATLFDEPIATDSMAVPRRAIAENIKRQTQAQKDAAPWSTEGMRPYQIEATLAMEKHIRAGQDGILITSATGTGKSIMLAKPAERFYKMWNHGILILAHKRNLIFQLRKNFPQLGINPAIEMGDYYGLQDYHDGHKVVIASMQTMTGDRLALWPRNAFKLIFIDEAHHVCNKSYKAIIEHFQGAVKIGLTATPTRADKKNLGRVFKVEAFKYPLRNAIEDGWLVPVEKLTVNIDPPIDLRNLIPKSDGDWSDKDLDAVIQSHLGSMVLALKQQDILGNRKTVAFAPWVRSAKAMSDALNNVGISANFVCGDKKLCKDPEAVCRAHKEGKFQVLVNRDILTEGYDDPEISCIINARPTRNIGLILQMVGRGTRPFPSAEANIKDCCLLVDFTCLADQKLVSVARLYDDSETDKEVMEIAEKILEEVAEGEQVGVKEVMEKAEQIFIDRERIRIKERKVKVRMIRFDPVGVREILGMTKGPERDWSGGDVASEAQTAYLANRKIQVPPNLSKMEASHLISGLKKREQLGLATPAQVKYALSLGMAEGQARRTSKEHMKEWLDNHTKK